MFIVENSFGWFICFIFTAVNWLNILLFIDSPVNGRFSCF